jgi:xanthine dehydrogenase YagR molybdenum-binding subunit
MDRQTGRMVNPNLEQYKIAMARETPEIEVILVEQYLGRTATDAQGIGEPANIPTAAAIANAVYNAIGVRVRTLPMKPAVVLAVLGKLGNKEASR